MCGVFGIISKKQVNKNDFISLVKYSRERGRDSSGFLSFNNKDYKIRKFNNDALNILNKFSIKDLNIIIGHTRLITNSTNDNQPITRKGITVIHNGIIVNYEKIFDKFKFKQKFKIDTEIIPILIDYYLNKNFKLTEISKLLFEECEGLISCAVAIPKIGKLLLMSNNGSLYSGFKNKDLYFASERFFLNKLNCKKIFQVKSHILDIPIYKKKIFQEENVVLRKDLVPTLAKNKVKENLLIFEETNLKRCSKCVLPSTMPFIKFDSYGICNYCNNYKEKKTINFNQKEIHNIFKKYKDKNGLIKCIVPLSGGRDSCIALHLAKREFNLTPITYTYDWGLVTDLARRNISRICSKLNIENIIFADNITKKRSYIKKNVIAWLKKPHLGMVNLFTSGDKHFFRHIETVKKRTGVNLDLWGINPYEVTHFKSGFLNIPPDFNTKHVYASGLIKQFDYHKKRFNQMLKNPSYFNASIFDNLHGEFYRSLKKRTDHYSIFDFWKWDENEVNNILEKYNWEKSTDTNSTWRIGDGAAAFYNYIYYTMAGFSEHDTFRSNQIRAGDITRDKALNLIKEENKPRYENLKWFLDILNLDFEETIKRINLFKLC